MEQVMGAEREMERGEGRIGNSTVNFNLSFLWAYKCKQ
jgi:hypothetical protein